MTVGLTLEMAESVKEAAAEVGVSPNAWAALKLGEAVRSQRLVSTMVADKLGVSLAEMIAAEMGGEDEK